MFVFCTFLKAHIHHAWFCQLQVEVFVFFIFLIINNFDLYGFTEKRKTNNVGGVKQAVLRSGVKQVMQTHYIISQQ